MTHFLLERTDWRETYLVYAALLALISAPLHAFLLPRHRAEIAAPAVGATTVPAATLPPSATMRVPC